MVGSKGLGALLGVKIACCGTILLIASGTLAATQVASGAALLLVVAASIALVVRDRRSCAHSARRRPAVDQLDVATASAGSSRLRRPDRSSVHA